LHPTTGDLIITPEERAKREDLSKEIVFTCDPKTARDLDDALSIRHVKEDIYEVKFCFFC
jgi:exoribonuclease R